MTDPILKTQNYYTGIDSQHYYKNSNGSPNLVMRASRATKYKNVYLSDLLNNPKCGVSFNVYRDADNKTAPVKTTDSKFGIVKSYNPETNLVGIDCVKKRPSRISTLFKRTNKMRYVEPEFIMVSSVSRRCTIRRVPASYASSNASPRAGSKASPRAGSASPRAGSASRGGRKKITRKRR